MNETVAINLIVRNEVERLKILFPLVKDFFDEIVVVDQESTDDTVELCEHWADKTIPDEATGNADTSRQLAMDNTDSDWILTLDADEFVTTRFIEDLPIIINAENNIDGYLMNLADIVIDDNEPYDISTYLRFGHTNGNLKHISYPYRYRFYRNRSQSVKIDTILHHSLIVPHMATIKYLWYNGIVQVKTRKEHKIDERRYEAIMNGLYNKDKFI